MNKIRNMKLPLDYGGSIFIVASNLFNHLIRERRFIIAAIYFVLIPMYLVTATTPTAVQTGPGIALFYAHRGVFSYIRTFYLSFFLGQILVVVLSADQIAGEIEQDTYSLLKTKPVYDSEIIIGKFLGLVGIIAVLDAPGYFFIYIFNLVRYEAKMETYVGTLDELFAGFLILVMLHAIIISFSLFFSSLFSKNLYSILSTLIFIFILSIVSGLIQGDNIEVVNNYISLDWLAQAILPSVLYHVDPLKNNPNAFAVLTGVLGAILGFLALTTFVIRNKELY